MMSPTARSGAGRSPLSNGGDSADAADGLESQEESPWALSLLRSSCDSCWKKKVCSWLLRSSLPRPANLGIRGRLSTKKPGACVSCKHHTNFSLKSIHPSTHVMLLLVSTAVQMYGRDAVLSVPACRHSVYVFHQEEARQAPRLGGRRQAPGAAS